MYQSIQWLDSIQYMPLKSFQEIIVQNHLKLRKSFPSSIIQLHFLPVANAICSSLFDRFRYLQIFKVV